MKKYTDTVSTVGTSWSILTIFEATRASPAKGAMIETKDIHRKLEVMDAPLRSARELKMVPKALMEKASVATDKKIGVT